VIAGLRFAFQQDHVALTSQLERDRTPGDAGADDQDVAAIAHVLLAMALLGRLRVERVEILRWGERIVPERRLAAAEPEIEAVGQEAEAVGLLVVVREQGGCGAPEQTLEAPVGWAADGVVRLGRA
jgi:hypothetical protein